MTQHIQMNFPAASEYLDDTPELETEPMLVCEVNHKQQCDYCGMCRESLLTSE